MTELKEIAEKAWDDRSLLATPEVKKGIFEIIERLDKGQLRVAQPEADGKWTVNEWVLSLIHI